MKSLKRALAVSMCAAMMVSSPALAASESPAKKSDETKVAVSGVKSAVTLGTTVTPVVKYDGKTLTAGKDYTVSGITKATMVGTKSVTIKGKGYYDFTKTVKYSVKYSASKLKVTVKKKTYNGKKITASVTVKYGNTTLRAGKDYTLTGWTSAQYVGNRKINVVCKGNYMGTKSVTYSLAKASQNVKASVNSSKKKVTVKGVKGKAKVTYKTNNKKVTVKNGKITVKKGVKKGTKVKITIKVAATTNYKSATKTVTYTVK